MDQGPQRQPSPIGFELIERPAVSEWMAWPELVRPDAHLRSPILDHRPIVPLPADPDRATMVLPAARDVLRPMTWAVVLAAPVLLVIGWQVALLTAGVTFCARIVDGRLARSDLSFASGFVGYRTATEWPRGVQEDSDVRWNWSTPQHRQGA